MTTRILTFHGGLLMQNFAVRLVLAAVFALVLSVAIEAPAAADTKIQKTFDQWNVTCVEKEKKTCALSFGLVNSKTKRMVLGWTITPATDGTGNKAIVRTPNGALLPSGITVKFATSKPTTIAFKTCGALYCIGEVPFSDAWLTAFKGGTTFTVVYSTVDGKQISREVNLKGFADGFVYYGSQVEAQSIQ